MYDPNKRTPLTKQELVILRLFCAGKVAKEIAGALNLSIRTIETHRTNMLRKTNLHSFLELYKYAVRNHIVDCPCLEKPDPEAPDKEAA